MSVQQSECESESRAAGLNPRERNRNAVKDAMRSFPVPLNVACAVVVNMAIKAKLDRADIIRITAELLDERGITIGDNFPGAAGTTNYSKLAEIIQA